MVGGRLVGWGLIGGGRWGGGGGDGVAEGLVLGAEEERVDLEGGFGEGAGLVDEWGVGGEVAEAQRGQAALAVAQHFARAAELEVVFGDGEAVACLFQDLESCQRAVGVV